MGNNNKTDPNQHEHPGMFEIVMIKELRKTAFRQIWQAYKQ